MYRRVRSLLVPYVFWILLYLVLDLFLVLRSSECTYGMDCINGYLRKYGYWHIFWDCNVMDSGSNNPIGFIQDSSSPLLFPLWFVRDLFVVSLFSPLLWWGVRKVGWVFIIVLGFFHVFQIWPCLHGFSSVSFFFFALGIFLNVYADNLDSYFRRFGMLVLLISVLLSLFLVYLFDTHHICLPYVVRCFTVFGSLSVLYLAYKCHDHKGVSLLISLAKGSFVVYAAHMVFISRYVRIFASHVFASGGMMFFLLEYLTVPIVISFICYLFYFSVKRFCPRLLLLINGGR